MTWKASACGQRAGLDIAHIFVSKVLEQFQLSVGSLGEHGSRKRFHDLLHGYGLLSELVLGGAAETDQHRNHIERDRWPFTKQDQKLPCPRAADLCICPTIN